jgi:RNA ligase (TIGR02306 family)
MSDRKLASIRTISEINPIEGADRIVKATVDGWELVTQKSNNFKPGDHVVYFEIDSLLPEIAQFEFLRPYFVTNSHNGAGFRLKTIRLRGQISQGLIIPVIIVDGYEYIEDIQGSLIEVQVDQDVTELLGVKKYEKILSANLAGKVKGNFPSFIPKTDQERIQNCFNDWFYKWKDDLFEVTMKLDGSSFTGFRYVRPENGIERFGICSRNLELLETEENSFWKVARKIDLEQKLAYVNRNLAIQGELMGPGIQGNPEKLVDLEMFVFDIFDIDTQMHLPHEERVELCRQMDLQHVPIIDVCAFPGFMSAKDFLKYAERPSLNSDVAEGVVFKSVMNPNCTFKAISNAFLLAGGE